MKFAQDLAGEGYIITAYDSNSVSVNGKAFEQSLIITATTLEENWAPETITDLNSQHIEQLAALKPELVIVGTGSKLVFPAVEVYASLIRQNTGIEFMDTGAACRTYNILMGEGRNVVAGIILEQQ